MSTIPPYGAAGSIPPLPPTALQSLLGRVPSFSMPGVPGAGAVGGGYDALTSGIGGYASKLYGSGAGSVARGIGYGAVPQLVNQYAVQPGINALPISRDQKDLLGNTASGAAWGFAPAAFLGPEVLPFTVPAGAAAGFVKGLAENFGLFGGDNGGDQKTNYKDSLTQAASQFGLDANQYTATFDLLTKAGGDEKTVSTALAQQLLGDAQTKKQYDLYQTQQATQHQTDQKFALAMQAQAQQFFTPYVNNIITAGQSEAELLRGQAASMPEPYRKVFEAQASQALSQSQRLAGAYAAQSAMLPSQYMMSADIKRQQELAQLQYQQSVINSQQGGGGSNNFAALSQQLANQGQ